MKPRTEGTKFGSITIDGQDFAHDVLIRLDGEIVKRAKKLSKRVYGTSHTISLDEARHIYEEGAEHLIIGTGQYSLVNLSDEARHFFEECDLQISLESTPDAIRLWNRTAGRLIGLFHVTC